MDNLARIGPAMTTAFLASSVEAAEALTIVLAWRRAWPDGASASRNLASRN